MGNVDRAILRLDRALAEKSVVLPGMAHDFFLRPLFDDSRFQALTARIDLPAQKIQSDLSS